MTHSRESRDSVYLLLGARGFMGSAFAAHLDASSRRVIRRTRGDALDDSTTDELKARHGRLVVVDFAYTSVPNSSFDDPVKDYSDNLRNVLRHLDFAKAFPGSVYAYISSGGTVYGEPQSHRPIAEDHRNVPLSPYGITKLACERYALMYHKVHGLDVRVIRPSNVYGPGQRPFRGQGIVSTMLALLLAGKDVSVFGDGSIVRDYVFIDDFCRALDDVVLAGQAGEIYNAGSGQGVSINDLIARMKPAAGVTRDCIQWRAARPFDVGYNVLDATRLTSLAGWRPAVGLDAGVARTAQWLRALPEAPT